MKKITLLLACLLLTSYSFGQMQVKWGPVYKKEGGMFSSFYLVGGDEKNYYLIMRPKKENTLLKYDYNHKLVSETPITFEYNGDNLILKEFIHTKAKTFGIFTSYDKKGNAFTVQAAEFSSGKFKPVKEIARQPYLVQYKFIYFGVSGYTDADATGGFVMSADSSHVATIQTLSSKEKSQTDQISIIVFDENMQVKWQKIQDFPYKDSKFDIQDFVVSNNGDVYLAATLDKERKEKEKGLPDYKYKILRISKDGYKDYDVSLSGNNVVSSAGLFISPNSEEVRIGGFTKDRDKDTDGNNGTFFSTLNASTGVFKSQSFPFSPTLLEGLIKEKDIDKGDGIRNFIIRNFVTFSDGSFSFIAEEFYIRQITTYTYSNGRSVPSTKTYYYTNEILIPRFNADGTLRNIAKVDKDFGSQSSMITSYSLAVYNDKLYLLYNDAKSRNEKKEAGNKGGLFGSAKTGLYSDLAVIGADGEVESIETLFTGAETEGFYVPSYTHQYGDRLLINNMKGKEYQFGTFILK